MLVSGSVSQVKMGSYMTPTITVYFFLKSLIISIHVRYIYLPTFTTKINKNPRIYYTNSNRSVVGYQFLRSHTVAGRNLAPVEVGSLSYYLQGFIHQRWLAGFLPSTVFHHPCSCSTWIAFLRKVVLFWIRILPWATKYHQLLQDEHLPAIRRVITPLIGAIAPVIHLYCHL